MKVSLSKDVLEAIHRHVESTYPEEGAGFLLGYDGVVSRIHTLNNAREDPARRNRYLLTPQEYLRVEQLMEELGLAIVGIFHSHPDHPCQPSEYDREWAQPFFVYMITSVHSGVAVESRAWKLSEDRSTFNEQVVQITKGNE